MHAKGQVSSWPFVLCAGNDVWRIQARRLVISPPDRAWQEEHTRNLRHPIPYKEGSGGAIMTTTQHDHDTEHDIGRFDEWSSTYERSWMQRAFFDPAQRRVLALAAEYVPRPASVLDVGCGTGRLLRLAATRWPEAQLIGVDPAKGMIETAKRLTPNASFFTGTAESLPLPDASVDVVLSTLSFHHWHDQAAGVREIARVLRPGGYFLLVDMSMPGWMIRVFRQRRVHNRAGLRALFQQAGLRVQRQHKLAWRGILATVGQK
jgi:ubiquinone/menaquinone biosynthesis C-methylase UbiE